MMSSDRVRRGLSAAALSAALLLAGCANNPTLQAGLGGPGAGRGVGAGGVAAPGTPQEFVVAVGDRVFFPVDQTDLTPQAQAILDRQAQWLLRYPRHTALVEGHADERGTREYNLALSARRATVVQAYLVGRGVAASRLRTISYGKERPVALCDDESCWSQNRRAVTVIDAGRSS
jgi:peptidoglycan-associated lipoprotein